MAALSLSQYIQDLPPELYNDILVRVLGPHNTIEPSKTKRENIDETYTFPLQLHLNRAWRQHLAPDYFKTTFVFTEGDLMREFLRNPCGSKADIFNTTRTNFGALAIRTGGKLWDFSSKKVPKAEYADVLDAAWVAGATDEVTVLSIFPWEVKKA